MNARVQVAFTDFEATRKSKMIVNGQVIEESSVGGLDGRRYVSLPNTDVFDALLTLSAPEAALHFVSLMYEPAVRSHRYIECFGFEFRRDNIQFRLADNLLTASAHCVAAKILVKRHEWRGPTTYAEFIKTLIDVLAEEHWQIVDDRGISVGQFTVASALQDEMNLRDELYKSLDQLTHLLRIAEDIAAYRGRPNALVTLFRFPPHLSTACQQYLLYFGQFLEDLGIPSHIELKETPYHVLFSVVPESGNEALRKLQKALTLYLELPAHPLVRTSVAGTDVAVSQLEATVLYLRDRIALAHATMQAKDAALEAMSLSNYQYRHLLSGEQPPSSNKPAPSADSEDILGGTVSLVPYEGKGFRINIPGLYRRLRRRLFDEPIQ